MKLLKICFGFFLVNLNIYLIYFFMEKFFVFVYVLVVLSLFDLEFVLNYKVMEFIDYVLFFRYSSNICDCEIVGIYV